MKEEVSQIYVVVGNKYYRHLYRLGKLVVKTGTTTYKGSNLAKYKGLTDKDLYQTLDIRDVKPVGDLTETEKNLLEALQEERKISNELSLERDRLEKRERKLNMEYSSYWWEQYIKEF